MGSSQTVLSFQLAGTDESLTAQGGLALFGQTAGKIVRHGRQTFLKINSALLPVFTAIRERCARFMQEGYVMPETS